MNQALVVLLVKIDRFCAWILLFSVVLFVLSGYGMTKGVIDEGAAAVFHLDILPLVLILTFVIHSGLAVRMALMRWRVWNKVSMTALILIYFSFMVGFGYLELFYRPSTVMPTSSGDKDLPQVNAEPVVRANNNSGTESAPIPESDKQPMEKTFTLAELAKYNGQNGMPAYVAVDEVVYDLTDVFRNGKHFTHFAGQELTDAFYSKHAKRVIAKYPVMGILK